ncbi:hypothetical protein Glove_99g374 [Diversispora epigaea]|uniref:Polycystin cation channel PKD1/PKD2 domain-containing protein n=1 Tax=Diversispora epigaea TaxID=1348612 RepID=A0A397J4Q5_9GLOM|nr:hypothetical protein Glove_99g374 [Diversispora epigaea]
MRLMRLMRLMRFEFLSLRFMRYVVIARAFVIFLSWILLIANLVFFKNIGIFIIVIVHICRGVRWLFILLTMIVFAIAHSLLILFSSIPTNFDVETKAFEENKFEKYENSLENTWTGFLNAGYDGLSSWDSIFPVLLKIIFSFFTAIIIMNLLIAFVNDVYQNINQRINAEWTTARAQVIAIIEISFSLPKKNFLCDYFGFIDRNNKNYFPSTIIYEVSIENIEKFKEETAKDQKDHDKNRAERVEVD